jgi:hypothetical protein
MTPLRTVHPPELAAEPGGVRWLVEPLWAADAVGLLAGAPKSCKTWLALDLAVSIATRTPCLGSLPVLSDGPVLLYAAEDAQPILRRRLEALAAVRGLSLSELRLTVIVEPTLRLDTNRDQQRLADTLHALRPSFLVLDPLIRLHRLDENSSRDISILLSYFRQLQREHGIALLLVHHMRKGAAALPGQSLRGSSDLHAWGDTNLYLNRTPDGLLLAIEHRAHPSPDPILLRLVAEPHPHLRPCTTSPRRSAADEIVALLDRAAAPLTTRQLVAAVRGRTQTTVAALHHLAAQGLVRRQRNGWVAKASASNLRPPAAANSFPVSTA